jgi:hypothetical protein
MTAPSLSRSYLTSEGIDRRSFLLRFTPARSSRGPSFDRHLRYSLYVQAVDHPQAVLYTTCGLQRLQPVQTFALNLTDKDDWDSWQERRVEGMEPGVEYQLNLLVEEISSTSTEGDATEVVLGSSVYTRLLGVRTASQDPEPIIPGGGGGGHPSKLPLLLGVLLPVFALLSLLLALHFYRRSHRLSEELSIEMSDVPARILAKATNRPGTRNYDKLIDTTDSAGDPETGEAYAAPRASWSPGQKPMSPSGREEETEEGVERGTGGEVEVEHSPLTEI